MLNEPRATIAASKPLYRACLIEGADLFLGQPDLDRVKMCCSELSRNRLAGFREWAGATASEWVRRGVIGDMGISRQ